MVPLVPLWTIKTGPRWYNLDNVKGTHLRVFLLMFLLTRKADETFHPREMAVA
jgi:hypothetical protein